MENIIIAGRGKTSRANIEALMEDYYYANKNAHVIVMSGDALTDSLNWAVQHASDMGVDVETVSDSGGYALSVKGEELKGTSTSVFLVWDDDDLDCQVMLKLSKENEWPVYDLTNGLCTISGAPSIPKVVEPVIPPEEHVEEASEYDEESESSDPLYEAINVIADIIAEAVYERLVEMQKRRR